jgi:hypothetical protein
LRKAIIGEHDVRSARERLGIGRRYRGDARIPIGNDGALAARIDENRRQRGLESFDPLTGADVDRFTRKRRQHAIAVLVHAGRPTKRPG